MKIKNIFSACLLLAAGACAKDLRIIGGSDADISQFPYFALFRGTENDNPPELCGGAFISDRHILTAAHCLYLRRHDIDNIKIFNSITASTDPLNGPYFTIENIMFHPDCCSIIASDYMAEHDIAVVKVKETIEFNEYQNKIDLPTEDIDIGAIGKIIGFGTVTFPDHSYPQILQEATMQVKNSRNCERSLPFIIHDGQFCGFQRRGVGICYGDSGGPFVYNNKVYGIISFNSPCAKGQPDVFTRVYYYLRFINDCLQT